MDEKLRCLARGTRIYGNEAPDIPDGITLLVEIGVKRPQNSASKACLRQAVLQ